MSLDPNNPDTDGDGIPDGLDDADGDGVPDGASGGAAAGGGNNRSGGAGEAAAQVAGKGEAVICSTAVGYSLHLSGMTSATVP